jgi:hypothetical protein
VTAEVILSELGDISRFRNAKAVSAYAGLAPAVRQSGGKKSKDLKITKEGSGLLRWALVEAAWRLVGTSPKWSALFARLKERKGSKRAIVAVARKLLCGLCHAQDIDPVQDRNHGDHFGKPASGWSGQDLARGLTTTTQTATLRTTRKTSAKAPVVEPTTTTQAAVPRATRRRSARTSAPKQTTTV